MVMPARKAPAPSIDLAAQGATIVSVFGPFNSRVLIEMSSEAAQPMFPEPFARSARTHVISAAMREVEALRERDAQLADSALAASAVALAYEIENPYNSATSKSMCARELRDTLDRLRELAPVKRREDSVDVIRNDLAERRAKRDAGGAKTPAEQSS
jgi:hypothetical protein